MQLLQQRQQWQWDLELNPIPIHHVVVDDDDIPDLEEVNNEEFCAEYKVIKGG